MLLNTNYNENESGLDKDVEKGDHFGLRSAVLVFRHCDQCSNSHFTVCHQRFVEFVVLLSRIETVSPILSPFFLLPAKLQSDVSQIDLVELSHSVDALKELVNRQKVVTKYRKSTLNGLIKRLSSFDFFSK